MAATLKKTQGLLDRLDAILAELETMSAWEEPRMMHRAPSVSGWSIAQQLHHTGISTGLMLLAADQIRKQEAPAEAEGSMNKIGHVVLRLGRMPRGKAKAPSRSLPEDAATRADVEEAVRRVQLGLHQARKNAEALATSTWRVKHPYLGMMDAQEWLRLADVHARHHFRIIEEIDRTR